MKKLNIKGLTEKYFSLFESKDLISLSEMFEEECSLFDWNISATGKSSVLNANKDIFSSFDKINVVVRNIVAEDNISISEINVITDNNRTPVVDVITFSENGKIQSIRAYRGN
jgi:hypothetical protein